MIRLGVKQYYGGAFWSVSIEHLHTELQPKECLQMTSLNVQFKKFPGCTLVAPTMTPLNFDVMQNAPFVDVHEPLVAALLPCPKNASHIDMIKFYIAWLSWFQELLRF